MTPQHTPDEPIYDGLVEEHGDVVAEARHAVERLQQAPEGSLGSYANFGTADQQPGGGPAESQSLFAGGQFSESDISAASVPEKPAE